MLTNGIGAFGRRNFRLKLLENGRLNERATLFQQKSCGSRIAGFRQRLQLYDESQRLSKALFAPGAMFCYELRDPPRITAMNPQC